VHAAGVYEGIHQECLSDYAVSSYTPTLAALLRAQKTANTYTIREAKFLMVAADRAHDTSLPILRSVKDEVAIISDLAGKANASIEAHCTSESTTTTQVAASLKSANFVHIACHGIQHSSEPLQSGFCLTNDNLAMTDLMKLDLKDAFFAFLSACETAHGDKAQPDQTIHLAASILFAGFKSVVATMW
jgi:CHAT domain-containing protein